MIKDIHSANLFTTRDCTEMFISVICNPSFKECLILTATRFPYFSVLLFRKINILLRSRFSWVVWLNLNVLGSWCFYSFCLNNLLHYTLDSLHSVLQLKYFFNHLFSTGVLSSEVSVSSFLAQKVSRHFIRWRSHMKTFMFDGAPVYARACIHIYTHSFLTKSRNGVQVLFIW